MNTFYRTSEGDYFVIKTGIKKWPNGGAVHAVRVRKISDGFPTEYRNVSLFHNIKWLSIFFIFDTYLDISSLFISIPSNLNAIKNH